MAVAAGAVSEHEVAEAAQTAILRGGQFVLLHTVYVSDDMIAVHDEGNVRPCAYFQRACGVDAVLRVPAGREAAVGIGVEHKGAPARAGALIPVEQTVAVYPELDSSLIVMRAEHIGQRQTVFRQIDNGTQRRAAGNFDHHLLRLLRAVERAHGIGAHIGVGQFKAARGGICLAQQLIAAINAVTRQSLTRTHRFIPT